MSVSLSSRIPTCNQFKSLNLRKANDKKKNKSIRAGTLKQFETCSGRKATFKASKRGSVDVVEGSRGLKAYMSLPATEYSVLDAEKVTRIDETTFRCEVTKISMFGVTMQPVLTAQVDVRPEGIGPLIKVVDAQILGSDGIKAANDSFMSKLINLFFDWFRISQHIILLLT